MFNEPKMNSICQILLHHEKNSGDQIYLRQPRHDVWHEFTWTEVMLQARKVAGFLLHLGLKKGSHVSIISKNCAEWFITDFGISLAGMVNVPLFTNQHVESIHYVLEHADVQLVFIGKLDDYKRVRHYIPEQYTTISFDYHQDLNVDYTWSAVMENHILVDVVEPNPDDLYTIIYSSGTSGTPKGAMYTHRTIANYLELFPQDLLRICKLPHYHLISYLPLAHVYERSAIQLASLVINCDVSFIESLDKFVDNLRDVQPTFFTAVPRIWGIFQQKIEQKISPLLLNCLLKIPLVSWHIKNKIKKELGFAHCTNYFSGASQLPIPIIEFFDKIGVNIQEGYGQTEDLAYATLSMLAERRNGYVGTPRLKVDITKSEDFELLLDSPCLMSGYYKDQEATKKAFTTEGWLRTGDVVEIDSHNQVKILGRISENFKNQSGEFVAPTPIEKRFASNPLIEQLCLVGRGLPNNILIVTLTNEARLNKTKDEVKSSLQESLGRINSELVKFEKICNIIIAKDEWTTRNDLLTPTLKVKRRVVEKQYAEVLQRAIINHQPIMWE